MELIINKAQYEVTEVDELRPRLAVWTYHTAGRPAFCALEYFFEEAAMAPWLHWYDDTEKRNV
jgi:hypothetical protein